MKPSFSGSYRDVIDNMDLALAIYRAVDDGDNFIFVDINSRVEEIEQVKRETLIGKRVTEIFPGVEDFGLLDVFRRVNNTGVPERFPISYYEDERIAGWRDNYVYRLESGEVVAIYKDETERKQLEEEINKSRDEKDAIIEGAADPIIVNNEERILFLNQKAAELFGYSDNDELIGEPFINLFSIKQRAQIKERARLRLEGKDVPDQYDSTIERLDGTIVPVEFHLSLIEYDGNRAILNIIRDISERKQMEIHIDYLYEVLLAIRNVNQLIVTEKDRDQLLQKATELLVESKGYLGSWITIINDANIVEKLYQTNYPSEFDLIGEDAFSSEYACLNKYMDDEVHVFNSSTGACSRCPFRVSDIDHDILSITLRHEGNRYGVFTASIPKGMTGSEELDLFREVALDIGYALHALDLEDARRDAEVQLRRSEEQFRT